MEISKALVVDDSRLARVALSKLLARRGMDVDTADCGNEALDYLTQTSPDVVFIDYMMPDMDGFQAAEAINRLRTANPVPLVMYTSQDTPEDRQRARDLGICGFLVKPTSDEGLDSVLEQIRHWRPGAPVEADEEQHAFDLGGAPDALSQVSDLLEQPGSGNGRSAQAEAVSTQTVAEPAVSPAMEPAAAFRTAPGHQAEPALTADQVRGIAEEVSRTLQAEGDKRWLQQLDQSDRRWTERMRDLEEQAQQAAVAAAQQAVEQVSRDAMEAVERMGREAHEAAIAAADRAARGAAEDVARTLVPEQAASEARQVAIGAAQEAAREAAREASRQAVEKALAETDAPVMDQDVAELARESLEAALQRLGEQEAFRGQVISAVNEYAVPMLKNRLDDWVRDRSRETALAALEDAVERRLETVVREAVAASAEAAARESNRLYSRWRMLWFGTTALLAAGVVLALAIAV